MEEEVKTSRAWLLDFGGSLQAAVGHHEMWQVILSPTLFDIPSTPTYCNNVLVFQGHILPVFNLPNLLGQKSISLVDKGVVGIAAFQDNPTHPIRYGCLHLASMPQNIYVKDDSACELSDEKRFWEPLAISSFAHEDRVIPIINLATLFSENIARIVKKGEVR